jgi:hypothetical protein
MSQPQHQYQQPYGTQGQPQAPLPGFPPSDDPNADPFSDPRGGGGVSPKPRNLVGRTVIIKPIRVDENAMFEGQRRPNATFDLFVVDGGPIRYGDSEERGNPRPHTHVSETPALFTNVFVGNDAFVEVCRDNIGGLVVGVVEQGTLGNKPFLIAKTHRTINKEDRPDGEQRRRAAHQLWNAFRAGQFRNPEPQLLNTQSQGQVPNTGYPPAYAQQYPQAPQAQTYASNQAPVFVPPAPAQQAQQGTQGQPPVLTPPPGWDASVWANLTPEQRQQIAGQQPAGTQQYVNAPTGY